MTIVVLDGYTLNPGDNPWTALEELGEVRVYDRSTPSEVRERAAEADVLITNKTPLPQEIVQSALRLKFISVLATGYNIVDIAAARQPASSSRTCQTMAPTPWHSSSWASCLSSAIAWATTLTRCEPEPGQSRKTGLSGTLTDRALRQNHGYCRFWPHRPPRCRAGRELRHARHLQHPHTWTRFPQQYRTIQQLFAEADVVSLQCALTPGMPASSTALSLKA